jgi:hypothetical protein
MSGQIGSHMLPPGAKGLFLLTFYYPIHVVYSRNLWASLRGSGVVAFRRIYQL